ncbi:MAG: hypothetical protein Kow0092_16460 [Deferrisomatales bacterium]
MAARSWIPPLCRECAAAGDESPVPRCGFCREFAFPEAILCDLNRSAQGGGEVACGAFRRARLRVVPGGRARARTVTVPDGPPPDPRLHSRALRDRWGATLRTRLLDPAAAVLELRYHLVWATAARVAVLDATRGDFEAIHEGFLSCSDRLRGTAALMHLDADHLHVFVESDGSRSVETIVGILKEAARAALEAAEAGAPDPLWDEAYFAGTIE